MQFELNRFVVDHCRNNRASRRYRAALRVRCRHSVRPENPLDQQGKTLVAFVAMQQRRIPCPACPENLSRLFGARASIASDYC